MAAEGMPTPSGAETAPSMTPEEQEAERQRVEQEQEAQERLELQNKQRAGYREIARFREAEEAAKDGNFAKEARKQILKVMGSKEGLEAFPAPFGGAPFPVTDAENARVGKAYLDQIMEAASQDVVPLLTVQETAGLLRNRGGSEATAKILEKYPKVDGEEDADYEKRIKSVLQSSIDGYSGANSGEISQRHEDFAVDLSYNLAVSQMLQKDKDAKVPDKETWLKQQRVIEKAQEAVSGVFREITGRDDPSVRRISDAEDYQKKKLKAMGLEDGAIDGFLKDVDILQSMTFMPEDIADSKDDKRALYNELREITDEFPILESEEDGVQLSEDYRDRLFAILLSRKYGAEGLSLENAEITGDDEENPDSPEASKAEKLAEREKILRQAAEYINDNPDIVEWLTNKKHLTMSEVLKLSNDEIVDLIKSFETDKSAEHDKKLGEFSEKMNNDPNFMRWIADTKHLSLGEVNKMTTAEIQQLMDEYDAQSSGGGGGGASTEEETPGADADNEPIIVADIDRTIDMEREAYDLAVKRHEEYINAKGVRGKLRRLIFGNLLKDVNIIHYEKQEYDRIATEYRNGTMDRGGIQHFLDGYRDGIEDSMIHGKAGEKYSAYTVKTDEEGNEYVMRRHMNEDGKIEETRLEDDDEMAQHTKKIRDLVQRYAERGSSMTAEEFNNAMEEIRREDHNSDRAFSVESYFEVAEALRDRNLHNEAMANVMDGFTYINGEARNDVRTVPHDNAVNKIARHLIHSRREDNGSNGRPGLKLRYLVPPELVAIGGVVVANATRTAASTAGKVFIPVGGSLVAGAFAGAKEYARVTEERANLGRSMARGEVYDGTNRKFTRELAATMPTLESASAITAGLNTAVEAVRNFEPQGETEEERAQDLNRKRDALNALMKFYGETCALIEISDEEGMDLVGYTGGAGANIEDQRRNLDRARAEAKKLLEADENLSLLGGEGEPDAQRQRVADSMKDSIEHYKEARLHGNEDTGEVKTLDASEKDFNGFRRRKALSRAAMTASFSLFATAASQEAFAAVDKHTYGLIDHFRGNVDAADAKETALASAFGFHNRVAENSGAVISEQGLTLTQEEVAARRANGEILTSRSEVSTDVSSVSKEQWLEQHKGNSISRIWHDNGTSAADQNELRLYEGDSGGLFAKFEGLDDKEICGYITLNKGDAPIKVVGERLADGSVSFDKGIADAGLTEVVEKKAFQWFEAASDAGMGSDGRMAVDVYATVTGNGYNGEGLNGAVETVKTVWDAVRSEPDIITTSSQTRIWPLIVLPVSRRGLDVGRQPASVPAQPAPTPISAPNGGEPTPRGGGEVPAPTGGGEASGGEAPIPTSGGGDSGGEVPAPTGVAATPSAESGSGSTEASASEADRENVPSRESIYGNIRRYEVPSESYIDRNIPTDDAFMSRYGDLNPDGRENVIRAIGVWNSLSSDQRRDYLLGRQEIAGLEHLAVLGIEPTTGENISNMVYRDRTAYDMSHRTGEEDENGAPAVEESGIEPEESIFNNVTKLSLANPDVKIMDLVRSADGNRAQDYIGNYFRDGYNSANTADEANYYFYNRADVWDKYVSPEQKASILAGGNASEILGGDWGYWVDVFEDMGLIEINKSAE